MGYFGTVGVNGMAYILLDSKKTTLPPPEIVKGWWTDKNSVKITEAKIGDTIKFFIETKDIKDGESLKLTLRDWDDWINTDDYPKGAPKSITINSNKGFIEFTIPKSWETDINDDVGTEIELYFDIKYKEKSYELPKSSDDYLKVYIEEVKITVLVELPHSLETGWGAKGLAGHTAMAIGEQYFDYGPNNRPGTYSETDYDVDFNDDGDTNDNVLLSSPSFKKSPGMPWWGSHIATRKGIKPEDVTLKMALDYIKLPWNNTVNSSGAVTHYGTHIYGTVYKVEFYVNKNEANEIQDWWEERYKHLKIYSVFPWTGEQCTTTTKSALKAGGIFIPEITQTPSGILNDFINIVKSTSYKHNDEKAKVTLIKKEATNWP